MFFLLNIFVVSKLKLYHGRDFSSVATIERDKTSKDAAFRFELQQKFTLYAGDQVNSINYLNPIYEGIGPGNFTLSHIPPLRKYFQLVTRQGKSLLADKHLPIENGWNFRDLGGIPTKDGRHIKWGNFFRGDEVYNFTDADLNYLKSISLQTVVDFRSIRERGEKPDQEISPSLVILGIERGDLSPLIRQVAVTGPATEEYCRSIMLEMYTDFVTNSTNINQFRELFNLLQNPGSLPLLFHCSAGKDRTGTAAFLILYSLGVSLDVIFKDYVLTNEYVANKYASDVGRMPFIKPLVTAREEYLQAEINTINEKFGSVEKFLTGPLNVNLDRMKELYLE